MCNYNAYICIYQVDFNLILINFKCSIIYKQLKTHKMGHWEDRIYEIHEELNKHGLNKKFEAQLKKMNDQDKHRYRDTRERWIYAHDKVMKNFKDNNKKVV
tara:strand:+ start:2020 stop:2322 length:303 start_codon:yes stop_codon:yes gene_type:complete